MYLEQIKMMNKKKFLIINIFLTILISITLPCYANMEICTDTYCIDWPENIISSIETGIKDNQFGINVILNSGHTYFMVASTKKDAIKMLRDGYYSIAEYNKWSKEYRNKVIQKQDKANFLTK